MIRVGFIGVPGTGKTRTSRGLAALVRDGDQAILKNVEYVDEYAREYIAKYGPMNTVLDQLHTLDVQLEKEDQHDNGKISMIVTDAPIFLGLFYANLLANKSGTARDQAHIGRLYERYTKLNWPTPRYDVIFHLPPVLPPVDDGVRSIMQFNQDWREEGDKDIQGVFRLFKPMVYHSVQGVTLRERLEECQEILTNYLNQPKT